MLNRMKGIIISVSAFALMHYAITRFSNTLSVKSDNFQDWHLWLNLSALAMYFISGFMAGIIQRESHLFTGMLSGFIAALLAMLIFGVSFGDTQGKLMTIATGIILGSAGGLLSAFLKPRKANAL